MLNKRLVKTVLLGVTLLSIIAVVNATGGQQPVDSTKATTDTIQWTFDSSLLKITGPETASDMPVIKIHRKAMDFAGDYIKKNGYSLDKIKEQNPYYFAIMDSVFTAYGLPVELKYLAIVESRLKVKTVSRAGAAGAWQLMPVAARSYSLKVNGKYDERMNFEKSTVAAAKLLRDLHDRFGDWLLVIAAYNSGPGGVLKAIKKSGSRNFWKLQDFLPKETRGHVKKFISTHYHFEQQGSVTTITKDEIAGYTKTMTAFVEKQNILLKEKLAMSIPAPIASAPIEKEEKLVKEIIAGDMKLNN
jgi:membrane-bound lytic murein transglycosylase D